MKTAGMQAWCFPGGGLKRYASSGTAFWKIILRASVVYCAAIRLTTQKEGLRAHCLKTGIFPRCVYNTGSSVSMGQTAARLYNS
jgi:hypothetical protein